VRGDPLALFHRQTFFVAGECAHWVNGRGGKEEDADEAYAKEEEEKAEDDAKTVS
jgi:hypothetical protein